MIVRLFSTFLWRTLLGVLLLGGLAIGAGYELFTKGLQRPLPIPDNFQYTLKPGSHLRQVAKDLLEQQVLDYPTAVAWQLKARWQKRATLIKAGEYAIPPASSAEQILEVLISGKPIQHELLIVEGWTVRQMLQAVQAHPKLQHTLTDISLQAVMQALGAAEKNPEGNFFPDTYLFEKNTKDVEILRRAYARMQQELAAAWGQKSPDSPLKSAEETLILASIIEKETGVADERPEIAGVFSRRLQKGMRLQTDPTVIYGLGETFDGNLRKADLERDTPYNSYTRAGLPPTPIALPGRGALLAAVAPAAGSSLYFVASGGGQHYFSATLEEHECAVLTYQIKDKLPNLLQQRCRNQAHCPACQHSSN